MNKKNLFLIITLFITLSGVVIGLKQYNILNLNTVGCSISDNKTSCGATNTQELKKNGNVVQGVLKDKMQLYGKPTFLRRAGKFCAYCRDKLPEVENLIFEPYKDKINIQIMTMDIEKSPFDTLIPQSPFDTFNFKDFVGEDCETFPTWVILDSQGVIVSQECGGKTTVEDVAHDIKKLL